MASSFETPRKSAAPQSLTEKAPSIFRLSLETENESLFSSWPGLSQAIHVFLA
jgi:hypothetical protein